MITAILAAWAETVKLSLEIWDWVKGHPKRKLEQQRMILEDESLKAQLIGDLDALRKVRAQIEDIDKRLVSGDY